MRCHIEAPAFPRRYPRNTIKAKPLLNHHQPSTIYISPNLHSPCINPIYTSLHCSSPHSQSSKPSYLPVCHFWFLFQSSIMSQLPPDITLDDLYPKPKVEPKGTPDFQFPRPTFSMPSQTAYSYSQAGGCSTIRAQPWRNRPHGFQDFAFGTDIGERFELFIMGDGEEK